MTQVNLLPGDIRERQRVRRRTAAVIAGTGVVFGLLLFVFVLQLGRLSHANSQLASQQAVNSGLQNQVQGLQQFSQLKGQLKARESLVGSLTSSQIEWSGVLRDVSMVIPGQMWLTSMVGQSSATGTAPPPSGGAVPAPSGGVVGVIQFQGVAFDQPTVAQWLTRLEEVNGWVNSWVSTDAQIDLANQKVIQFTGTVDLTNDAVTGGGPS
jgi:Tfp pilus assembly protein PilN